MHGNYRTLITTDVVSRLNAIYFWFSIFSSSLIASDALETACPAFDFILFSWWSLMSHRRQHQHRESLKHLNFNSQKLITTFHLLHDLFIVAIWARFTLFRAYFVSSERDRHRRYRLDRIIMNERKVCGYITLYSSWLGRRVTTNSR